MHWKRGLSLFALLCAFTGPAAAQTPGPPLPLCFAIDGQGKPVEDARWIVLREELKLKLSDQAAPTGAPPKVDCEIASEADKVLTIKNKNDGKCVFDPKVLGSSALVEIATRCVLKSKGAMTTEFSGTMAQLTLTADKAGIGVEGDRRVLVMRQDGKAPPAIQPLHDVAKDFQGVVFWLDGAELHAASTSTGTPPPDRSGGGADGETAAEKAIDDCRSAVGRDNGHSKVLCFQASGTEIVPIHHRDPDLVIRPNTPILVVVSYRDLPTGTRIAISAEGQVGLFTPGSRNETGIIANARVDQPEPLPFIQPLGPYLPGSVTVHVRVVSSAPNTTPIDLPTQLIVEETFSGALRLGIGGVFGGAVERGFALRTAPGSSQPEIVATNGGDMDAELVLGAAIFLEQGGRGYVVPSHNAKFAPYFGIGILDQTDNGLKLLRSVHLGLEYEFNAHFSIAVTVVGRRITRLSGAELGDPVAMGGALPTETGFAFGGAVVINLTPDFFKLATKSGSSFFGGK